MDNNDHIIKITKEVIALLKKYNLIVNDVPIPDEWVNDLEGLEDYSIVEQSLIEFIPERHVDIGDMCAPGIWQEGSLVDEYSYAIKDLEKASGGKFKVENFKTENPTGESGEEDPEKHMMIEFDHNKKHYKWEFSMDDSDKAFGYYIDLAKLFTDVLQENLIFLGEECVSIFCIPKELISELEKLGVDPSANPLTPHIQAITEHSQADQVKSESAISRLFNRFFQ